MVTTKTRKINRNRRNFTYKQIRKIYEPLSGFSVNTDGYDPKFHLTYGEITCDGSVELANIFTKLRPINNYSPEQRVFYDLGSGIGKNVVLLASLVPYLNAKGIELVKDRHDTAMSVYNNLTDKSLKKRIEFINGSFLDKQLGDAAWIFISNLCFSKEVQIELAEKLSKELRPQTLIACSQEFEFPEGLFTRLDKYTLPMSWNENSSVVFMYRKN